MTRPSGIRGCLIVLALLLACPGQAAAEEVLLRTKDGSFEIRGNLIDNDGRLLTIESAVGVVAIPAAEVDCSGPGCPGQGATATSAEGAARVEPSADLAVAVDAELPGGMLGRLIEAYGAGDGVEVAAGADRWTVTNAAGSFRLTVAQPGPASLRIGFEDDSAAPSVGYSQVIGLDPVVAVTAPGSRPASLTLADIGRIYTGRLTDWSALGVRGGRIVPVLPADDPIIEQVLTAQILGTLPSPDIVRTDNALSFLLSNPGAIALLRGSARGALGPTPLAGECGLLALPDDFSVRSGQYPLVRRVVLSASTAELAPQVMAFLDFLSGLDGQRAVTATGLTGQDITTAPGAWRADWIASAYKLAEFVGGGALATDALQELSEVTRDAERLSVTLRYAFDIGAETDAAQGDFARLADAIRSGAFGDTEVLFVGYTDSGRGGADGRGEALLAAERVMADFLAAHPDLAGRSGTRFTATGFGAIAPLLCSGTPTERAVNQRVEVWRRPL